MTIAEMLLPEFDHESASTRRLLERVPLEKRDWKPHAKSSTLGDLAAHIAQVPSWISAILDRDEVDGAQEGAIFGSPPVHATTRELLAQLDANVAAARAKLAAATDERLRATWTFRANGRTVFAQPRVGVLRGFVFSHGIHHRGQLTVYLRMLDVPLPQIYGPTADSSL